jgi:DNA-3-methyladenine glycosylase II
VREWRVPERRVVRVPSAYRLDVSVAPAAWVDGRSSRHAWLDRSLVWCGWEGGRVVWRRLRQRASGELCITGSARVDDDERWVRETLNPGLIIIDWDDPMLFEIAGRYPGLAPYCDGSLFEGLVTSIVGQSISVASAAMAQARLARLFGVEIRIGGMVFSPLPSPGMLADVSVERIRTSGVTTRRAMALKRIAEMALAYELPSDDLARSKPEMVVQELLALPQVGPWTAVSALLWGVGAPDAWPTGDVAVLRALRHAYADDTITLKTMDHMAERWRPNRGIAARLLWTNLFGIGQG